MAARYKLERNPSPTGDKEEQPYHARVVAVGTLKTEGLLRAAQGKSSVSSADIKGTLQLLHELMRDYLMMGYNVELEGIGTFSLSAQCRPVMNKNEIRAESIHFKSINYRPAKILCDKLKATPFVRAEEDKKERFSPKECEQRLLEYLNNNQLISHADYRGLCHCSKSKAAKDLKRFYAEGKIVRHHFGSSHYYSKPEVTEQKDL